LNREGVPAHVATPIRVADLPVAKTAIALLRYFAAENAHPHTNDNLLVKLLHQPVFGLLPSDINSLLIELAERRYKANSISLRGLIHEKLHQPAKDLFADKLSNYFIATASLLKRCFDIKVDDRPGDLLQQIVVELIEFSPANATSFPHYKTIALQLLMQATESIKQTEPACSINDWITRIATNELMHAPAENSMNNVSIIVQQQPVYDNAIYLQVGTNTTAAGAVNNRGKETLVATEQATPAKTFPLQTSPGYHGSLSRETKINQQSYPFPIPVDGWSKPVVEPLERALADKLVKRFVMSATALNNYLQCPLSFYYNNILCVPQAKSAAMAFGTAVHYALQRLFEKMQAANGHFPTLDTFVADFLDCMHQHRDTFDPAEFDCRVAYGTTVLTNYYNHYQYTWPKVVVIERHLRNIVVNDVPVKGKPDKLEFNGHIVTVIDYKTGSVEKALPALQPPNPLNENGGNYWRQAVFYKLLVDNCTHNLWKVDSAAFDFIEPNAEGHHRRYRRVITPADVTTVTLQLKDAWTKIQAHDFYTGCGKTNCSWCNLAVEFGHGFL
jgi:hypothetical protein